MFKSKQAVPKTGTSASPRSSMLQSTSAQESSNSVDEILKLAMPMMNSKEFMEMYDQDPNAALSHLKAIIVHAGFSSTDTMTALKIFHQKTSSMLKANSLSSSMQKMKIKPPAKPQLDAETKLAFQDVYSTNIGFKAINDSLRSGKITQISASKVKSEIERRHGQEVFFGTEGKNIARYIGAVIQDLNAGSTSKYTDSVYNRENTEPTISFRGQGLTAAGLEQLKSMEPGAIIHSKSIMSVSKDPDIALKFAKESELPDKLIYRISGTSATPMRGRNRVVDEKESLFSPLASFKFLKFHKKNNKSHFLELEEINPDKEVRARQPIPH